MKTGKSLKALFLAGFFILAFTGMNTADAQRRQPTDCIEDSRGLRDARYNGGLVERFEDIRSHHEVIRDRWEDIQDKKENIIDRREERRHRRF